jgi:hypothetical protein
MHVCRFNVRLTAGFLSIWLPPAFFRYRQPSFSQQTTYEEIKEEGEQEKVVAAGPAGGGDRCLRPLPQPLPLPPTLPSPRLEERRHGHDAGA